MLDKASFRTIRQFGGSQQGGLEELICQLAHLAPPANAKSFIRKEGAGGDAGVECFWIMNDGSEHAWQAKYFLNAITPSQWKQIDSSVETALKKHPNLKKYYVCVPVDRTDTRSTMKGGKQAVSVLSEWNEHVEHWMTLAVGRGMKVDFEYWGAHEILSPLQSNDPKYAGRALFWFNALVLTEDKLEQCILRQEKILGERYTPEFHVDLPIAHTLDGLTNGNRFWSKLNEKALDWDTARLAFFQKQSPKDLADRFEFLKELLEDCKRFVDCVVVARNRAILVALQGKVKECTSQLFAFEADCRKSTYAAKRPDQYSRSFQDEVSLFVHRQHSELSVFLKSDFVNANVASALLLTGEAGAGKSHLLCDFAKTYVKTTAPAILMLGQHYRGGNPLADLLDLLDLNGHSYETVLGAIDAAGESSGSKSILLIDAINEGSHRNEWRERIIGVIEDVKRFSNIALIISCRSRFDDILVPPHICSTELLRVTHQGFRGHEHKAAAIYLSKQGIAKPTTPITAPEFSNPLFLKTCAKALKRLGETTWPKGYQGASRLFKIYVSSLEHIVSRARQTEINDALCQKALEAVANAMFPENLAGLPWDHARSIVNSVDTCVNPTESLFQTLLREGALAEDIEYSAKEGGDRDPKPIIRFAYERFCDHFVAQRLAHMAIAPAMIFDKDQPLGAAITKRNLWPFRGILAALSIIVPEIFRLEFWDAIPESLKTSPQSAEFYFFDSLQFRDPSSFTARTKELFNTLPAHDFRFQNKRLDLMVQFATEPNHPWNANQLHATLSPMQMPDRDSFWSIYVAKNDYEQEDEQSETIVRSIIDWATFSDLRFVEEQQAHLSLITLIWFTTTTNRRTRDQATKAAARLIAQYPQLVVPLLEEFRSVDDLYLQERLYAIFYGGLCNADDDGALRFAAKRIYEIQFENSSPIEHILLRDYARGIVELALFRNCLHHTIRISKCRPPHKSGSVLENPPANEFNHFGNKIEYSVFSDDFGHYTIKSVREWSPTSLEESTPETQAEILEKLCGVLDQPSKELFDCAVAATKAHESLRRRRIASDPQAVERMINSAEIHDAIEDARVDSVEKTSSDGASAPSSKSHDHGPDQPSNGDVDDAWAAFNKSLDESLRDKFRWAQGFWRNGNLTAAFSKEWAKRWVCKHAIALGWTAKRFQDFEESLHFNGRERPMTERIGKKYQRVAYHTFLACLSDRFHFIGDARYCDSPTPSSYRGPWQLWERDIDPTHWLRRTSDAWNEWNAEVWWRPFEYKFGLASDDVKSQWCEDPANLPKFERYIKISDELQNAWYSLRGFSKWREKKISGDDSSSTREIWFRINSIMVRRDDLSRLKRELNCKDFISPDIVSSTSTFHQIYLREYPWHPSVGIQDEFAEGEFSREIKVPHVIPYAEYEWEQGSGDQSADMNLGLYIPSSFLTDKMALTFDRSRFDRWLDNTKKPVFFDPSLEFDGPSFALLDCNSADKMLAENGLVLVWLVGGEKMIVDRAHQPVKARMVFNSLLWTTGDGIVHSAERHYMEGAVKPGTRKHVTLTKGATRKKNAKKASKKSTNDTNNDE